MIDTRAALSYMALATGSWSSMLKIAGLAPTPKAMVRMAVVA